MSDVNGTQAAGSLHPLLASIPHSVILCILVVIPASLAQSICQLFHIKLPLAVPYALIFVILLQLAIFGFMWVGITIRGHNLQHLLGKNWQNVQQIKADAKLAVLLAGLQISMSLLLGFLGPFKHSQPNSDLNTTGELLLAVLVVGGTGFTEEFIFRGYFLRQIAAVLHSEELGVIFQAVLFAFAHGFEQTLPGILDKFIAGCIYGWFAIWSKSLLPGIIAHCTVNMIATIVLFWLPQ